MNVFCVDHNSVDFPEL